MDEFVFPFDPATIAEIVASVTHDSEPSAEQVEEWLQKQQPRLEYCLEEAVYYAVRGYIHEYWPCPTCGLIRKTFGCYDACRHPDQVGRR